MLGGGGGVQSSGWEWFRVVGGSGVIVKLI